MDNTNTATSSKIIEAVTRRGQGLWKMTETGPRGGKQVYWCERVQGETEPNAWRMWSPTIAGVGDVVCAHGVEAGK